MKKSKLLVLILLILGVASKSGFSQQKTELTSARTDEKSPRLIVSLNGTWDFDQTLNAFPPSEFTRKIPVPGLIHLAEPRIVEYDKFFKRPGKAEAIEQFNLYNLDYTPRYSWYRKTVFIPKELETKEGIITVKKSQYVTQVYINGIDMGTSMACYTPIEFPVNKAIKFGKDNEILIRVGERIWLPAEAAGGTDKEKEHYLPGIWDNVFLSFTGNIRINRLTNWAETGQLNKVLCFLGEMGIASEVIERTGPIQKFDPGVKTDADFLIVMQNRPYFLKKLFSTRLSTVLIKNKQIPILLVNFRIKKKPTS